MSLSQDPLYISLLQFPAGEFKPLGGGPATSRTIPRSSDPIDARSLGYADPRVTIDMQIARREGDPKDNPTRGPEEEPTKEEVA
jgi:hypothetical protein